MCGVFFLQSVITVGSLYNFRSIIGNVRSLTECSVKLFVVSMITVINASEAEIGAVDRSSDDDLSVLYHESSFQLSGGRGGELSSCCTSFEKSHWRIK
jgi:hypothetical protein